MWCREGVCRSLEVSFDEENGLQRNLEGAVVVGGNCVLRDVGEVVGGAKHARPVIVAAGVGPRLDQGAPELENAAAGSAVVGSEEGRDAGAVDVGLELGEGFEEGLARRDVEGAGERKGRAAQRAAEPGVCIAMANGPAGPRQADGAGDVAAGRARRVLEGAEADGAFLGKNSLVLLESRANILAD